MGVIHQGILGGFRNKTGSVVGAFWRSLNVMKGLPKKSSKPPTDAQKEVRDKFGLVTNFLSWISPLVEVGFKGLSGVRTAMNAAVAYHIENALTGVWPALNIDYTKVMFSKGKLALPSNITIATTVDAQIDFSWANLSNDGKYQDATDKATIMVYNPVKQEFVVLQQIVARSAMSYDLAVPANFSGDTVHCYISFNSVKTKGLVSESYYAGALEVQ
ncbi:DUF6266 family protein [Pedobacter sp. JY14-1]|uniref:DUF6266 family protein n=1 Tax=Pedobacter sp. JY14-1 TaxID=3034151 RepID=UPI0023E197A5|nr:DUF6266 family protein [Pedobacter sp. JY14-1]